MEHATLNDTVYFYFASNDTSGSGGDGATPVYDVRLAGAAAGAAPVLSGSATLLTHANFPNGCHEVAIAATTGNGFATGNTYAVFCTLLVDSQNPTGFIGKFVLKPIIANVMQWLATAVNEDTAGYPVSTIKDGPGTGEINTNAGKIVEVETLSGHTAQSGDGYVVVNHADHGNAKLVRSTTPANTLDVAATGEAGLDFDNAKGTHPTVPTVTDVTNDVGITQAGANKVWDTAVRVLTSGVALTNAGIDAILNRPISNLDSGGGIFRSLYGLISKLVNKSDTTTNVGKLTIFKTDDSTELATQTLTSDATANPITGVDTD